MKYAFPAVISPDDNNTLAVIFPDIPNCFTCGDDLPDAIYMAQDALCLILYSMEQDGTPIPDASEPGSIQLAEGEFVSIIAVDTETYRRFYSKKAVKKTLSIPAWLNDLAEKANAPFSHILQQGLKEYLNISDE